MKWVSAKVCGTRSPSGIHRRNRLTHAIAVQVQGEFGSGFGIGRHTYSGNELTYVLRGRLKCASTDSPGTACQVALIIGYGNGRLVFVDWVQQSCPAPWGL